MSISRDNIKIVDLSGGSVARDPEPVILGEYDILHNNFGVEVYSYGEKVDLSGVSCIGYFIRPNQETVVINNGTVVGNIAFIKLPQSCYTYVGHFTLIIKLVGGEITGTVRIIDGTVANTTTGNLVVDEKNIGDMGSLIDIANHITTKADTTDKWFEATLTSNAPMYFNYVDKSKTTYKIPTRYCDVRVQGNETYATAICVGTYPESVYVEYTAKMWVAWMHDGVWSEWRGITTGVSGTEKITLNGIYIAHVIERQNGTSGNMINKMEFYIPYFRNLGDYGGAMFGIESGVAKYYTLSGELIATRTMVPSQRTNDWWFTFENDYLKVLGPPTVRFNVGDFLILKLEDCITDVTMPPWT